MEDDAPMTETTIAVLLIERNKLTEKMRSWFCGWNKCILLQEEIREIDNLILKLNK